jgi:nitroimidazol reductase NimA-like FMN-containing flavoprotein (pyridoxamine 5'-phosphate oxidase superfamily)
MQDEGEQKGIPMTADHNLNELSVEECYRRLNRHGVGRIGVEAVGGPDILPVNYRLDQSSVIIRTSPYGPLSEISGKAVAFEVDDFDADTKSGWSVLLKGSVRAVEADELAELRSSGSPEPWPGGVRNLYLRLSPHHVTGRELR